MNTLAAILIILGIGVAVGLSIRSRQHPAENPVERPPLAVVEKHLLTLTTDLEDATLELKKTVAELRGIGVVGGGVGIGAAGGAGGHSPPG